MCKNGTPSYTRRDARQRTVMDPIDWDVNMSVVLSELPMRLAYPARFEPAGIGYVVTFRDFPEATTRGETRKDAREMAAYALASAVAFCLEEYRGLPEPSDAHPGEELVPLPQRLSVLAAALNQSIALGVHPQVIHRLATAATAPGRAAWSVP